MHAFCYIPFLIEPSKSILGEVAVRKAGRLDEFPATSHRAKVQIDDVQRYY